MTRHLLALALAGTACLGACSRPAAPPSAASPSLTVAVVQPRTQPITREVIASGTVAPWEEIQVGSELTGVRVQEVTVDIGDRVKRGDVLVRLDGRTAAAELARTEAAVAEAVAALELAEARAKRTQALAAEQLVATQDVDDVVAQRSRAQAQLDTARANQQASALRVEFTVIKAPADGVVSARTVQPGQMVGNGELLRLIRDGRLEWRAEIDEQDLLRVSVGASVSITAADGAQVQGRVARIAPGLDLARRTGTVHVALSKPGALRAGTFAEGRVTVGSSTALTVPTEAVVRRDGRAYVFLVDKDQRARERLVTLGATTADAIEISDGLQAGEAVVARGAGFLNDGDLVRVTDAPAAAVPSAREGA